MNKKIWAMALALGLFGAAVTLPLSAQQGGGGGGGGGGNGGQRMTPEERKQAALNRVKDALGATDEDWKAISPKVEKVQTLQFQALMQRFGGGFGGRNRNGGGGANPADAASQPANPVRDATNDLQKVVDDKGSTTAQITEKLTALREAKAKAAAELKKAQDELRELLTPRQEAVLVTQGLLD